MSIKDTDSKYYVLKNRKEIDVSEWNKFVKGHKHGNVFQTPYFYDACEESGKHEPVVICICGKADDEIRALILAVIHKEHTNFIGRFSARSIIMGGPLVENEDADLLRLIINEYTEHVKGRAIYSEFRNLWDWEDSKSTVTDIPGFEYEEHLNILIDLTESEEQMWKDVNSKKRNKIRKAGKEGTTFEIMNNQEGLQRSYDVLVDVYKRAKLPLPDYEYFNALYKNMVEGAEFIIFVAVYDNKVIGCRLNIGYNGILHDLYAGAFSEYYKKNPNDLLPWEIFKWAKQNGYHLFDFGGAGKPNIPYGVRDYKIQFGGELVNHGRFKVVHNNLLYKAGTIGLKLYKALKKWRG